MALRINSSGTNTRLAWNVDTDEELGPGAPAFKLHACQCRTRRRHVCTLGHGYPELRAAVVGQRERILSGFAANSPRKLLKNAQHAMPRHGPA
eukprot:3599441-Rhodomonas_salina.2